MGSGVERRIRLAPGVRLITCKLRPGRFIGPPGLTLQLTSGEDVERVAVMLDIAASGDIRYRRHDGHRIPDPEARALRRHNEATIRTALEAHCERLNAELEGLDRLHEQTPPATAKGYQPRSYPVSPPPPVVLAQPDWRHALWPAARARLERENARRKASHEQAYRTWEWEKADFDAQEFARQQREEVAVWDDPDAIHQTLAERLNELSWPHETLVEVDLSDDLRTIALDIELPGEDALPDRCWSMPAKRLKLTPVKLGTTRQHALYRRYVHGTVFLVLGTVLARLPGIEQVLISGYHQIEEPDGEALRRRYMISSKVPRESWERIDVEHLSQLDPEEALADFSLRRELTGAGAFCDISPFELDWRRR